MTSATSATSPTIHCITCGYDLRRRGESDLCPECGRSVVATLAMRPLSQADPRWLRRIASGARLMGLAVAALAVVAIRDLFDNAYPVVESLAPVAILAFGVLSVGGAWRLATGDRAGPDRDGPFLRNALRAVDGVIVAAALLGAARTASLIYVQTAKATFTNDVHRIIVLGWEWTLPSFPILVCLAFARLAAILRRTHAPRLRRAVLFAALSFALPMLHLLLTMVLVNHYTWSSAVYRYVDAGAKVVTFAFLSGCTLAATVFFITATRLARLARPTIAA